MLVANPASKSAAHRPSEGFISHEPAPGSWLKVFDLAIQYVGCAIRLAARRSQRAASVLTSFTSSSNP
jgi:hypothetical protein